MKDPRQSPPIAKDTAKYLKEILTKINEKNE